MREVPCLGLPRLFRGSAFPFPGSGGVRLMLVASNPNAPPAAPAVTAPVVLGDRTRIVLEPDDEVVRVYYLLDIANNARAPVNPPKPFEFGGKEDFQLAQAMNLLKGHPVLASIKALSAQVKTP